MGPLSTHVLDVMNGCPAAGMTVKLESIDGDHLRTFKKVTLNADGRADGGPLLGFLSMSTGRYRLVFSGADNCRAKGVQLPSPPFIDEEPTDFEMAEPEGHYDAPLLVRLGAFQPTAGLECDALSPKYSTRYCIHQCTKSQIAVYSLDCVAAEPSVSTYLGLKPMLAMFALQRARCGEGKVKR